MRGSRYHLAVASLIVASAACGNTTQPTDPGAPRPEPLLNILQLAQNAPPLFNSEVSFWALKGQDREGRIFFQDAAGGQGEKYLSLKVPAQSLMSRPDGSLIAAGDSILITVRVVDVQKVLFELEPSGLKFDPTDPAELDIEYDEVGDDIDGDGDVDPQDSQIETQLAIWRQELPNGLFEQLSTLKFEGLRELEAKLTGFSRYAIAY